MPNYFLDEIRGSSRILQFGSTIFGMKVPRYPVEELIRVDSKITSGTPSMGVLEMFMETDKCSRV